MNEALTPQPIRRNRKLHHEGSSIAGCSELPILLTADDLAALFRTSRKAVYTMIERGLVPGVVRMGRRVLIRRDSLIKLICQKSTPSQEGQ